MTNYSRCSPWAWCTSKLDQTNCTDASLAPLLCPIDGKISTVSLHIICKTYIYTEFNRFHRNTSHVCDDAMDTHCVTPSSGCNIHKHQLCNNITDCKGGSDEEIALCYRLTSRSCYRKYLFNTSLRLPLEWIGDGVEDCLDGVDEQQNAFNKCDYPTFTIYGVDNCKDVYVCPSGHPHYVEIESLCDRMLSCKGGSSICDAASISSILITVIISRGVSYLYHCLPGLSIPEVVPCTHEDFPDYEVLGARSNFLYLPSSEISCRYTYGELYVYLSCSAKCLDARCPITEVALSSTMCSNMLRRKTYSISNSGRLILVEEENFRFKVKNLFVCGNENCVPYNKVCNLIDDCGDGTDEDSCNNHFVCNVNSTFSKSYIPLSTLCDGVYDCLDLSDELSCCDGNLIDSVGLKASSWIIGVVSVVLNTIVLIQNMATIKFVKSSATLADKTLIMLIGLGDLLIGIYLIIIATFDLKFGADFCRHQIDWLISHYCSILGVVSTLGSQISLFALTILGATRLFRISQGLAIPKPVQARSYGLLSVIVFTIIFLSVVIAVTPLIRYFEDIFINSLYLPQISFLRGFVSKNTFIRTLEFHHGRLKLDSSQFSWHNIRSLMFTERYGGITETVLGFYGNDPVCLFKFFVSSEDPQKAYSWTVLGINLVCFGVISVSYITVFVLSSASASKVSGDASHRLLRNRNSRLQKKIFVIILTDFLCWVPFIIISLLHTIGVLDASPWYAVLSILILPINSVINPLIYDDTIKTFRKRFVSTIRSRSDRKSSTETTNIPRYRGHKTETNL